MPEAHCGAMDKMLGRRGQPWARCSQTRKHDGNHHDTRFPGHRWEETFFELDFVTSRAKTPTKRKVRSCKRCGKQFRTDGSPDACVCKEIEVNRRQTIMFADEREKACRDAMERDLDDDLAWLTAKWEDMDRLRLKMIAESEIPYYGEF